MDKREWFEFFRWLEQAGPEELRQRKTRIAALVREIDDRDVRSDARRMMRLIDQDILAREGIVRRSTGSR
jgi:hypothetical protein